MTQLPTSPRVIEVNDLRKVFGSKPALKGIDLHVAQGTVLGLLGQNGSGKTTLIKCLLGLLRISEGTASILGEGPWNLSAQAKARIGYVPQEVTTYPWMRCRQVIDYTAAFYPTWNRKLVAELCDRWQVPLEDRAGTLSVGQMQALGIVLALGHEPDLLVFDEPVASLDPAARRQFLRTLLEIVDDQRRTILFSTHITADLERIATRVALMKEGRIAFDGELDQLKSRVKRLRLVAANELPRSFAVAGALRTTVDGRLATVCVGDYSPELVSQLAMTYAAEVTVEDLNLEEIFVELHEPAPSHAEMHA